MAFANADGGELYVGVEDDGTITGTPHGDAQMRTILEAPRTHVCPRTPLASPTVARVLLDGKVVIYFQTAKVRRTFI